ncbi:MAG: hypothetical protein MNPFHGCM_02517 [Gemmatimonadaceae bacterium]|nr:hypothetical protein [Gemmatimonadaceae bacterium]
MTAPVFRRQALAFLRQLKRHNDREWFAANRHTYERELLQPLRRFVEEMDVRCASFAPEIVGFPQRSIFRIYRDIRFSKDKSPFKTHASFWMTHRNAGHGVGSETHGAGAGYYFHLEPGESLVAGGIWMPPRDRLALIREALLDDHSSLVSALGRTAFKRRFSALSEEGMLKRMPRGVDPRHPAGPLLRHVSFTVSARLSDSDVVTANLADRVERDFRLLLPFVRWLNDALGYPPLHRR